MCRLRDAYIVARRRALEMRGAESSRGATGAAPAAIESLSPIIRGFPFRAVAVLWAARPWTSGPLTLR